MPNAVSMMASTVMGFLRPADGPRRGALVSSPGVAAVVPRAVAAEAMRGDAYSRALRGVVTDFLGTRDGATYYVQRISGLWQRYDLGDGPPLVGGAAPSLRLDDGTRLADHSHEGRARLVDLAGDDQLATLAKRYAGRLELVRGSSDGAGGRGLLVRPDGFVGWAAGGGSRDPA